MIYIGLKFKHKNSEYSYIISNMKNNIVIVSYCDESNKNQYVSYTLSEVEKYFLNGVWIICIKEQRKSKLKKINKL